MNEWTLTFKRLCLLFGLWLFSLLGCATPATPNTQPEATRPTTPTRNAVNTPLTTPNPPSATASTSEGSAAQGLQRALELTDGEMRAAQTSMSLPEARAHAEAVVNIIVGMWGRWYGDGDGDRAVNDPSDKRGVLPGERIPEAAPDVGSPIWPYGWGVLTYDAGDESVKQSVRMLLGDVEAWQRQPRARYDEVARAVEASDTKNLQVNKLDGRVLRVLAWARLMLTKAQTLEDAKIFARFGSDDARVSLDIARRISR